MTQSESPAKGYPTWASKDGAFHRSASSFRDVISKEAGAKFPPEKGRYHLYVSLACPWAHRVLIVRKLKGLEDIIPVSIVHPYMDKLGWSFVGKGYGGQGSHGKDIPNVTGDRLYGKERLRDLYFEADKDYSGRFTVPTFWDTKSKTIVNNESSEIIRFLNDAFDDLIDPQYKGLHYYPPELRKDIDAINEWVYDTVNNGVYKSGFATSQEAYESNVQPLFESLDRLEKILEGKQYLVGDQLTEADIRLYTTIVRFDPVYVGHFKCNRGTIRHSFPNLHRWLRELYWTNDAFKSTTDFDHIKIHYHTSHPQINPTQIVPFGPIPPIEHL